MKTQTIAQYKIESGIVESGKVYANKPYVRIYNTNARAYNTLKKNIVFQNKEQKNKYIDNFISNVKSHEERKAERRAKNKAFKNPAKIGDILSSSWGYEQTNVDFYQVVEIKGRNVIIRKISGKMVPSKGYGGMAGKVKPIPNSFLNAKPKTKRALPYLVSDKHSYYLTMNSYSNASPCNPEDSHYCSWGH